MNEIFVFSSNLLGIHGAGAAKHAREHYGAQLRVGVGRTGNAYAIPTKRLPTMKPEDIMSVEEIRPYVTDFIQYAREHPELTFTVVKIGCGLSGHDQCDICVLFKGAPLNVQLPDTWRSMIQLLT